MEPEAPRGPSFMDRLREGLMVPTSPIRHKNVGSRNFLRGLVAGVKGDRTGANLGRARGYGSGSAVGADGLTAYQRAQLGYTESRDRRAGDAADRQAAAAERAAAAQAFSQADSNRRYEAGRGDEDWNRDIEQRRFEETQRHNRFNENMARQREQRMLQSANARLSAAGVDMTKWPEAWKREYSGLMSRVAAMDRAGMAAAADAGIPYDPSAADAKADEIAQRFADRSIAAGFGVPKTYFEDSRIRGQIQSGGSTSGQPTAPAPQGKTKPTPTQSGGVPKRGSW